MIVRKYLVKVPHKVIIPTRKYFTEMKAWHFYHIINHLIFTSNNSVVYSYLRSFMALDILIMMSQ